MDDKLEGIYYTVKEILVTYNECLQNFDADKTENLIERVKNLNEYLKLSYLILQSDRLIKSILQLDRANFFARKLQTVEYDSFHIMDENERRKAILKEEKHFKNSFVENMKNFEKEFKSIFNK